MFVAGGFTYIEPIEVTSLFPSANPNHNPNPNPNPDPNPNLHQVTSLFPSGGPLAGGYSVTVHGAQFPKHNGGFGRLGLLCGFSGQRFP